MQTGLGYLAEALFFEGTPGTRDRSTPEIPSEDERAIEIRYDDDHDDQKEKGVQQRLPVEDIIIGRRRSIMQAARNSLGSISTNRERGVLPNGRKDLR